MQKPLFKGAEKLLGKTLAKKGGEEALKAAGGAAKGAGSVLGKVAPVIAAGEAALEAVKVWQDPDKGTGEKLYDTGTVAASATASVGGAATGAAWGAVIGSALGPLGSAVGGFVGGVVGSIASSSIVRGIAKGIKGFFKGLFGRADEAEDLQQRMQELAAYNPAMGEELEEGFQDFMRRGAREQRRLRAPYEADYAQLQGYKELTIGQYHEQFAHIAEALGHYAPQATQQAREGLAAAEEFYRQNKDEGAYAEEVRQIVNSHVAALGQAIQGQLAAEEEAFIQSYKKQYLQGLNTKIHEYERTRETLEVLLGRRHGRLYDQSQGMLNRAGFELLEHYRALAEDPAIQELIAELGRMRQAEKEYEKALIESTELKPVQRRVPYFREELVGVTMGGELAHILPSEYALLAGSSQDPGEGTVPSGEMGEISDETAELLELLFYKKLSEKELNIYEFSSIETDYASYRSQSEIEREKPSKKGPFILCVDTSGSMSGSPERVAKTLAFIILRTALAEHRKCYLITFSTGIETLDLSQISHSLESLLQFLGMSFHGGTDLGPALEHSLQMLQQADYQKADVVMVSDFEMPSLSSSIETRIKAAQKKGTKFHSVVIGAGTGKNQLFDSEWIYNDTWSGFDFLGGGPATASPSLRKTQG